MWGWSMTTNHQKKEAVLVLDTSAKSSIPIIEDCAGMGLHVIAGSSKRYNCGFYCRGVRERLVYPSSETHPKECLEHILNFLRRRSVSVLFPVEHAMSIFIAEHQDAIRRYTRLVLPPYDVFYKGLNKIHTLKAAEAVGCPIPRSWYPQEQPIEDISRQVGYPVLIKPAISVGARGITYCHSADELITKFPKIQAAWGESFVQEFVPQTGIQYKCAIIVDQNQKLLSGIVYAKLRYYPPTGGSSTLNKSVHRPDIMNSVVKVAQYLKWVGTCDFDLITDPRDDVPKLMEINPRYSDTYKMTTVAGMNMTKIMYQLAKGETPEPQLEYKADRYLRFLFGDIMWFLTTRQDRWSVEPPFFDFFRADTTWLIRSDKDWGPVIGYVLENLSMLWNKKDREFRLRLRNV
jgi:D-aspartate ligase